MLCVADFFLHPDHDAQAVKQRLAEVAEASSYLMPGTKVSVVVRERPWGTHYKLKAYVKESREQFEFLTDLTIRGKGRCGRWMSASRKRPMPRLTGAESRPRPPSSR